MLRTLTWIYGHTHEANVRKELKLPVTKDLVYYAVGDDEPWKVQIVTVTHVNEDTYDLHVVAEKDGKTRSVTVLSPYFAEMQKQDFVETRYKQNNEPDYGERLKERISRA